MKVLLFAENPPSIYGGIERHCLNLINLFYDSEVNITMISKNDIPYYYIKGINKIVLKKKCLKKIIINSQCDVIHIHGFASIAVYQVLKVALKLHIKTIYTGHFHPFKTLDNPFLGKCFFNFFLSPTLSKIDHIITINNEDTLFFKKYNNHITMIPNWLQTINCNGIKVKQKSNMILFVGRNDRNKSPEYLIDIPKEYEVHCVTNSTKKLRNDFIIHKKITDFELNKLYQQTSLLVVPSRYEAFSYVVLESLIKGTPILISDQVRIIDHLDGISGITVFKYGDKNDFLQKIKIAMQQPVNVKKIMDRFNLNIIRKQLLNIYQS